MEAKKYILWRPDISPNLVRHFKTKQSTGHSFKLKRFGLCSSSGKSELIDLMVQCLLERRFQMVREVQEVNPGLEVVYWSAVGMDLAVNGRIEELSAEPSDRTFRVREIGCAAVFDERDSEVWRGSKELIWVPGLHSEVEPAPFVEEGQKYITIQEHLNL